MGSDRFYYLLIVFIYIVDVESSNCTSRAKRQSNKCILPPPPEHGKWEILGGCGSPGNEVTTNTLLTFSCDAQYKLSTSSPYVICNGNWDLNHMPTCEKLCSPILSTVTTTVTCKNKGQTVNCHEATDGTSLQFSCPPYYEAPLGSRRTIYCIEGEWSAPRPMCQAVCGKKVNDDVLPIIAGGTIVKTIELPWIIALYRKQALNYNYICGGSILSRRVVLTAAHCVTDDYGNSLPATDFQVAAAKLYSPYKDPKDPDAQYLDIEKIIVNSQYKGESRRFIGDVALLITTKMFKLNPLVQPICFNGITEISLQVGYIGLIASWGNSETNQISEELRFLSIPYKYDDVCEKELPSEWSEKYNILDKMCAGFRNQSKSVCKGDSGSALAFKNPEDNRYYVHGVASLAPVTTGRKCNMQQNALYTKVSFYYEFIDRWVTLYQEDDCLLPPYPKNGIYFVKNNPSKGPGDLAFSNDVLRIQCNPGYELTGAQSTVTCEAALNMPSCEAVKTTVTTTSTSTTVKTPSTSTTVITPSADFKVICTYASWSWYKKVTPDDLNVNLCTHFHYAFVGLSGNGKLKVDDSYTDIKKGLYVKFTDLKKKKPDLKMLLSVGGTSGTNNTLFSNIAKSASKTETFIDSAKSFMTDYNFDGINIDWPTPKKSEKDNYITFLTKIKEAFKENGWLVTASCSSDLDNTGYVPAKMNDIVEYVIIKTYDMYGHWSKYTGEHTGLYPAKIEYEWEKKHLNVDGEVNNWLKAGLKKDKLVISVAFYGRTFKLKNEEEHGLHAPTTGGAFNDKLVKYSEFCSKYNNSDWTGVWNDEQKSSYYYKGKDWFSIDTKDSMWIKGAYIKEKELLGVNVWSVDYDDVFGKCGTKFELLKHLNGGMGHQVDWNE